MKKKTLYEKITRNIGNVIKESLDEAKNMTLSDAIDELKRLGINSSLSHFDSDWNTYIPWFNDIFNLQHIFRSCKYGVQEVFRYDSEHIVYIEYQTGNWNKEYHVAFGESGPRLRNPKARKATAEEEKKLIEAFEKIIEYRHKQIEEQSKMNIEELQELCVEYANDYLKDTEYFVEAKVCSNQSNPTPKWRIVVYAKGYKIKEYGQSGYIEVSQDKNGLFYFGYSASGIHTPTRKMSSWNDYKSYMKSALDFIID